MPAGVRFGTFELDLQTRELRKGGHRLRVPDQSLEILAMLAAEPGRIITREAIYRRLWPNGTVVEFDNSVNSAVRRLREALSDSADTPRYIETLPRRGYRFLAAVEPLEETPGPTLRPLATPRPVLSPGGRVSAYRVVSKLGEGGMGEVWLAEDTRLGREVALKVLPRDVAQDPARRVRFTEEARAASALNHPGIVTVHDIGTDDGIDYIVMERVEGKPLSEVIPPEGLEVQAALRYGIGIAAALCKAHASGIVHRDLKPDNVMVTPEGTIKLLDFGLAQPLAKCSEAVGTAVGTPGYMSPEQAKGQPADARSDIYALGAVLYEMLTGAVLHDGRPDSSARLQNPAVPPALDRALARALRPEPASRWQTMSDFRAVLEDVLDEMEAGSEPLAAPLPKRRLRWPVFAAALCLIAALPVFWLATRGGEAVPEPHVPLTFDSGLTTAPAISPDGNLAVYASDRGGEHLDLYLQHVSGRAASRLTREEMGVSYPQFSPDGSRIFYQLARTKGGICSIDALTGQDRRVITDEGFAPRLSPDGRTIAYLRRGAASYSAPMFTVPSSGGSPRPFHPEFLFYQADGRGSSLVWSPDSRLLMFMGRDKHAFTGGDWFVAPASGGPAVPTGFAGIAARIEDADVILPSAWVENYIYYASGTPAAGVNLYRARIDPETFRMSDTPERFTSGPGVRLTLSAAANGRVVYSNLTARGAVWSVPLDADRGVTAGARERVTSDETAKMTPAAARGTNEVAFASFGGYRNHQLELRVADLRTRREDVYPVRDPGEMLLFPRLSRDGRLLGWVEGFPANQHAYLLDRALGTSSVPQLLCKECRILDFYNSGATLLSYRTERLAKRTGATEVPVLRAQNAAVLEAALSPDERWLALSLHRADDRNELRVMRLTPEGAATAGVSLEAVSGYVGSPRWAPNGRLLYYLSDRDGHDCIWAYRVDQGTMQPLGQPFAVLHEHRARYPINIPRGLGLFDLTPDRLVYWVDEMAGNIWMTRLPQERRWLFSHP